MKNKIRRAFDLTKPNVMNRVLEDCPAPENATAKPKRKRLSDRATQLIATAASIAMLISAAGGGFLYYRDYFSGQGSHSGSYEESPDTAPDINLGWDATEDEVIISAAQAKKIALEHAQGSMGACKVVSCELVDNAYYKVGISGEILTWFAEVYVDAYTGEIIEPTIPAEAAQAIALQAAIAEYGDAFIFDCKLVNGAYYKVGVGFPYGLTDGLVTGSSPAAQLHACFYFVDAYSGQFLESAATGVAPCTEEDILMIASAYATLGYESYTITDCVYHFRSGLPSFYTVTMSVEMPNGQSEISIEITEWYASYPVTPPIDTTLTMLGARNVALGMRSHYADYIHCLKISENGDFYTVYYEQGEYAYEFHIDFDGNVLYDAGEQHIGLRADQQMGHLIGWEKARNIALDACGRDVTELIGFTYEYFPGDPDYYHLELYFDDDGFTYRIGALNGELLEGQTSPQPLDYSVSDGYWHSSENWPDAFSYYLVTSAEELNTLHEGLDHPCTDKYDAAFFRENALLFLDLTTHTSLCHCEVTQFSQDAQGNLILGVTCYTPEVITDDIGYCSLVVEIHQAIQSGTPVAYSFGHHVLTQDEWNALLAGTYPGDQRIDVETATQIAMEYTGHLEDYIAGYVTDLACKFDEYDNPAAYYIYFQAGSESFEVGIDAATGEVLFCNGYAIDEPILDGLTQDQAIEIALWWCGTAADKAIGLQCQFVDTALESCYRVRFHNEVIQYEVYVHPVTGDVLGCQETPISTVYTEEDAINVALSFLPQPDTYPVVECHQIGTEPGRIIYMVVCRKPGMSVTTMVDGNTLRIMDYGAHDLEGTLTEQQVRSIAYKACDLAEEGPAATAMLGIFNDGVPFYCVKVFWDEMVHVVVMDANSGEVLSQIKYENTRIPGLILSEDDALEYALANAFVSLADAEDPTVVHDADSQTYTVTFRYQGDLCIAIVDDYNGSIIDMYWIVDE